MKPIATGADDLADQSKWPPELFAPNTLCYGLARVRFDDDDTFPPSFVSFCWKGRSLPIYLRTKYTEFNHVIRVRACLCQLVWIIVCMGRTDNESVCMRGMRVRNTSERPPT